MLTEAPMFITAVTDDTDTLDTYGEYAEEESESDEDLPDPPSGKEEEIVKDEDDVTETIDDVVDRSETSNDRPTDTLKDLPKDIQDDIVENISDAEKELTDVFYDTTGKAYSKSVDLDLDVVKDVVDTIEDVLDVACTDGIFDRDFDNSILDGIFDWTLGNGALDLTDCLYAKGVTNGIGDVLDGNIVDGSKKIIEANGIDGVEWMVDVVSGEPIDKSLTDTITSSYKNPLKHKPSDADKEKNRIEKGLDSVNKHWLVDAITRDTTIETKIKLSPFLNASKDALTVMKIDDRYYPSVAIANHYRDIPPEFKNI